MYGALLATAEAVASYLPGPDGRYPSADGIVLGMSLHVIVLFALLSHAALMNARGQGALAGFLAALSAVPLIRIFSLSLPFFHFTLVQWLLIISVPLLLVSISLMRVLGLRPAVVGLQWPGSKGLVTQILVGVSGAGLGLVEYLILRPSQAWVPNLTAASLLWGIMAITLSSGLAEELIFRGVLLRKSLDIMGPRGAVLVVTALFTVMHLGFLSFVDVAYVFGVGLFFALVVLRTKNLYGVVASHSLANVVLYVLAPFLLGG